MSKNNNFFGTQGRHVQSVWVCVCMCVLDECTKGDRYEKQNYRGCWRPPQGLHLSTAGVKYEEKDCKRPESLQYCHCHLPCLSLLLSHIPLLSLHSKFPFLPLVSRCLLSLSHWSCIACLRCGCGLDCFSVPVHCSESINHMLLVLFWVGWTPVYYLDRLILKEMSLKLSSVLNICTKPVIIQLKL